MSTNYFLLAFCCLFPVLCLISSGSIVLRRHAETGKITCKSDPEHGIALENYIPPAYLAFIMIAECFCVWKMAHDFGVKDSRCFMAVQLMSGNFRKFMMIAQAYVAAHLVSHKNHVAGIWLGGCCLVNFYMTMKIIMTRKIQDKLKEKNLLMHVESN